MKGGKRLTLRFVLYFMMFYIFIIIALIGSLVAILYFEAKGKSTDILIMEDFEMEDYMEQIDGKPKIKDNLIKQAKDNGGELYLLTKDLDVLQFTGENCELCQATVDDWHEFTRPMARKWKVSPYYIYFVPNDPFAEWQSKVVDEYKANQQLSKKLVAQLTEENIAVDIYNEHKRIAVFGEQYPVLTKADLITSQTSMFEKQEFTKLIDLDNETIVLRQPNELYRSFDDTMVRVIKIMALAFLVMHLLLLFGVILLSISISRQFVRPVIYLISRIERLARFDYSKPEKNFLYNSRNNRMKRKYVLFQPVDESLNNLAERLSFNERQIKGSEQLREEWITGLSHDLKTPLSSILGYSAMLNSDYEWTQEEIHQFAAVMQEKALYMDALIQDLTYTYQLKNGAVTLARERIDLQEWMQQFDDEDVDVLIDVAYKIEADKVLLQRIFDNLVNNAKKHTPEQTKVLITASQEANAIIVNVRDYGPGIPQQELDNLFERYYRGTNTTDDVSGTGLGLAITKQLIALHGGNISILSSRNGTIFRVILPK